MDFGSMSRLSLKELFRLSESLGFLAVAGYPLPPAVKIIHKNGVLRCFHRQTYIQKGKEGNMIEIPCDFL